MASVGHTRHARAAAVGAARRVHAQRAAVAIGQRGRGPVRIGHGLAAVPQPVGEDVQPFSHGNALSRARCARARGRRAGASGARRSQVDSAVGEVEALVAERKVRDGLRAHRQREAGPVVERRVHDLVAAEAPGAVGQRDVADLAAPALRPAPPPACRGARGARRLEALALGRRRRAARARNSPERWISSQRTRARASTSPPGQTAIGQLREAMPAGRVIVAHVAHAVRTRAPPDRPGPGPRPPPARRAPMPSKRVAHRGGSHSHAAASSASASASRSRASSVRRARRLEVVAAAARAHQPAAEAIAAQRARSG